MPTTDARRRPDSERQRLWSLAAAIASVTVFGLSVGQAAPLLSLLLNERGIDPTVNGLNAGSTFVGVIIGPLLAPRFVRWLGVRDFLLVAFVVDVVLFTSMKLADGLFAWFVLRALLGVVGSGLFTSGEAWINRLASGPGRGRIIGLYGAGLAAGFGLGPLLLSVTGTGGWTPFLVNAGITLLAMIPLLGVGHPSRDFGRERGANPLVMAAKARDIMGIVLLFGAYESALMALLPIWGVRSGLSESLAAATVSAVYLGSILLQILIGWLSDAWSRRGALLLCGAVGLIGAILLVVVPAAGALSFGLLFVWGGAASGIYPVALSMAGDRFHASDLVSVNAAIIMAYGLGALVGPALAGVAMDLRDPQGLPVLFALLFACLLVVVQIQARRE